MGCDIHLHAEIKVNGQWHHYSHPQIDRNYELFGLMAGVRDHETSPISAPRGVPDDASFTTRLDFERWGIDAHTPSWLGSREIVQVVQWLNDYTKKWRKTDWYSAELDQFGFLFGNGWLVEQDKARDHGHPRELEDVRWVFWFDN